MEDNKDDFDHSFISPTSVGDFHRPIYIQLNNNLNSLTLLTHYNGDYGKSAVESQEDALKIALSLSASEIKHEPQHIHLDFMELFYEKKIPEALWIYKSADEDAKGLIDSTLNEIPWRISCEYYKTLTDIQWMNIWIKIGWWPDYDCEISPQCQLEDKNSNYDPMKIKCVVWSGYGKDMILRLLTHGSMINVELEPYLDLLIPINVAFTTAIKQSNVFDIGSLEIGSLDPLPNHQLDILRLFHNKIDCSDGTQLLFFKGCFYG